jgi:transcriptional regulator with XRE-family HTH domain
MPGLPPMASESADRVAKFWFCGLSAGYSRQVDDVEAAGSLPHAQHAQHASLPVRRVTVNAIVALNLAYFRKAAGLKQEELAERLGWGKTTVSTAERSWDAKRVRSFSAEDLTAIAVALGIPLAALFLPPEDDGTAFRYVLDIPGKQDAAVRDLLPYAFPVYDGDSPAMDAFRKRLFAAGVSWSEHFIDQARHAANEALGRARSEADRALEAARRAAVELTGMARARAEALEEQHRQAMMSLYRQREEAERRVDDLRAFEREYRTRAGAEGVDTDQLLAAVRQQASEHGAGNVTAILLGEDGAYDVVQLDQPAERAAAEGEGYRDEG